MVKLSLVFSCCYYLYPNIRVQPQPVQLVLAYQTTDPNEALYRTLKFQDSNEKDINTNKVTRSLLLTTKYPRTIYFIELPLFVLSFCLALAPNAVI